MNLLSNYLSDSDESTTMPKPSTEKEQNASKVAEMGVMEGNVKKRKQHDEKNDDGTTTAQSKKAKIQKKAVSGLFRPPQLSGKRSNVVTET
jgi:hypothetical protein